MATGAERFVGKRLFDLLHGWEKRFDNENRVILQEREWVAVYSFTLGLGERCIYQVYSPAGWKTLFYQTLGGPNIEIQARKTRKGLGLDVLLNHRFEWKGDRESYTEDKRIQIRPGGKLRVILERTTDDGALIETSREIIVQ